jgi:hypothetical protein
MKRNSTFIRRVFRHEKTLVIVALAIANAIAAPAQQTNRTSAADFSSFQVIGERNIFNPTRTARHRHDSRSRAVADSFSLVGTMTYAKGTFAFFDGTTSQYRKALQNSGTIAGYKVTDITPTTVKLINGDKELVMKVGAQMRREEKGSWQLVATGELPADTVESTDAAPAETATSDSSNEGNDVLKRLMKQREQELQ